MSFDQIAALAVLVAVVAALIHGKLRADVVALTGAAVLLMLGVVRPVEVQGAFASPAVIALAGLFVIAYAIELSGLLAFLIRQATRLTHRLGALGIWLVIGLCGSVGGFLNNTPVVVLAAPVVRDMALSLNQSPKRYLMPLSYIVVMGGLLTLIGTSTNLLVNDMARNAGQPVFGLFDITGVGIIIALTGAAYLYLVGARQLDGVANADEADMARALFEPHEADPVGPGFQRGGQRLGRAQAADLDVDPSGACGTHVFGIGSSLRDRRFVRISAGPAGRRGRSLRDSRHWPARSRARRCGAGRSRPRAGGSHGGARRWCGGSRTGRARCRNRRGAHRPPRRGRGSRRAAGSR